MIICINHHQAPLQTLVQHHNHNNNEHNYHSIAIRHVAAYKYINKFWKQTIAIDAAFCYVIITLFYVTLTLQIMLINVIYLDMEALLGSFCVCTQTIRTCVVL